MNKPNIYPESKLKQMKNLFVITGWEYDFCNDLRSKSTLTDKQIEVLQRINDKVDNGGKR